MMMMKMKASFSRRVWAFGSCPCVCRSLSADAQSPSCDGRFLLHGVSSEPPAAPSPSACETVIITSALLLLSLLTHSGFTWLVYLFMSSDHFSMTWPQITWFKLTWSSAPPPPPASYRTLLRPPAPSRRLRRLYRLLSPSHPATERERERGAV